MNGTQGKSRDLPESPHHSHLPVSRAARMHRPQKTCAHGVLTGSDSSARQSSEADWTLAITIIGADCCDLGRMSVPFCKE